MRTALRISGTLTLLTVLFTIFLAGCGGGGGGSTGFGTGSSSSSSGGGSTTGPSSSNIIVQPRADAGTPGASPVAAAPSTLFEQVCSLVASTVHAAGATLYTLPGFTVTAFNSAGVQVASVLVDSSGNAVFTTLAPGNYVFRVSSPTYPNTVLSTVLTLPEGQSVTGQVSAQTTAATICALAASGGNIAGLDTNVFTTLLNGGSPQVTAVYNQVAADLTNGRPMGNFSGPVSSWQLTDAALQTAAQQASDSVFMVTARFPYPNQTGVARSNLPLYVAFNRAADPATLAPTYTNWEVRHNTVSTGQLVVINDGNYTAYGNWSYSDSARTVAGYPVPAHALVFTYTGSMAANAKENFQWSFGTLPKAATGTALTSTEAQGGMWNDLTFYTGSN